MKDKILKALAILIVSLVSIIAVATIVFICIEQPWIILFYVCCPVVFWAFYYLLENK